MILYSSIKLLQDLFVILNCFICIKGAWPSYDFSEMDSFEFMEQPTRGTFCPTVLAKSSGYLYNIAFSSTYINYLSILITNLGLSLVEERSENQKLLIEIAVAKAGKSAKILYIL